MLRTEKLRDRQTVKVWSGFNRREQLEGERESMEKTDVCIRPAQPKDAAALLEIYAPYVEKTAVSFEYTVPSVEEFAGRIAAVSERYPYLAAEVNGRIEGYAYAARLHPRAAYDWAVETSIYVRRGTRRSGVGRALYEALERALSAQGVENLYAEVAYPPEEDEHLTLDSVRFHERMGYTLVGRFHRCGYKFGRWYDMAWMEKHLGAHSALPAPVHPFRQEDL